MDHQQVQLVWRVVYGQHEPILRRFGKGRYTLGEEERQDVRLLKVLVRLVEDDRHPLRELMIHLA